MTDGSSGCLTVATKTDAALPAYTFDKVIEGYAYPRNGHLDQFANGAAKVAWITRCGGEYVGRSSTLKAAKELAALHAEIG